MDGMGTDESLRLYDDSTSRNIEGGRRNDRSLKLGGSSSFICVIWGICTWNPTDPCFDWKRPGFGGLTFKNRGHLGSRYIYVVYTDVAGDKGGGVKHITFPVWLFFSFQDCSRSDSISTGRDGEVASRKRWQLMVQKSGFPHQKHVWNPVKKPSLKLT